MTHAAVRPEPIRVLVADDAAETRDAYLRLLTAPGSAAFDAVFCSGAAAAGAAVQDALAAGTPFAIAILDVRMPPGTNGVWAAARIRELDPAVEIVICTACPDVDAGMIAGLVPPEEKLSYLQKPFHADEIRQMALSLASKWRSEQHILKLAYFDALTGLPNRDQCRSRLAGAIAPARAGPRPPSLAVLYLDLDDFKRVNDSLGHKVGDELLCVVANRLSHALRQGPGSKADLVASARAECLSRLGGDEFIAVLTEPGTAEDVGRIAQRLGAELQRPIKLGPHTLVVTASIGIALYPRDAADVDTLLRHADLAMYESKRTGAGNFRFFGAAMNESAGAILA
jgi:diguanylate cyclase (GGDEF)-like protein